LTSR
jgi:hypothetical protein